MQEARTLCEKESLDDELEFLKTTFREIGYSTKQIRRALNLAVRTTKPEEKPPPGLSSSACPDDTWPTQQNPGQTRQSMCWPAAYDDAQSPSPCEGRPGTEESGGLQHTPRVWSGVNRTDW